jgi:hypothetical protein
MAIIHQNLGFKDSALGLWLEVQNYSEAQKIFMDLAPLYFGSAQALNELKIHKIDYDMRRNLLASCQNSESLTPAGFRKSGQRIYVDYILKEL